MRKFKGVEFSEHLLPLVPHMHDVDAYREVLQKLQAVWDNLSLLGELSGIGVDIGQTRQDFEDLSHRLLDKLAAEGLYARVGDASQRAQIAIDILVRNLFERTADIGFLATDDPIVLLCEAARGGGVDTEETARLQDRFAEYVASYSVYHDIVLMGNDGRILCRYNQSINVERSHSALIRQTLESREAYVESFGPVDFLPGTDRNLVYSWRVGRNGAAPAGILCLCFDFDAEIDNIFSSLRQEEDWSVLCICDDQGDILASSDTEHIPVGRRVRHRTDVPWSLARYRGQPYLCVARCTQGYQGYQGPGWHAQVLIPLFQAFQPTSKAAELDLKEDITQGVARSSELFDQELRDIVARASNIQARLDLTVWNGTLRQQRGNSDNSSFAKTLLREIGKVGSRTEEVFQESISQLHNTVIQGLAKASRNRSQLAMEIMDRNLYERANDCRWWAQNPTLVQTLAITQQPDAQARTALQSVLRRINRLYTVYTNLLLLNNQGEVVAMSDDRQAQWLGHTIDQDWAKRFCELRNSQEYAVSDFTSTPLYDEQFTYIYGATVRDPDSGRSLGAIAIVFDSAPQFRAMLEGALPRDRQGKILDGSYGLYVEPNGRVVACSDDTWRVGQTLPWRAGLFHLTPAQSAAHVIEHDGIYYALSLYSSAGYREYKGANDSYHNPLCSVIAVPLCSVNEAREQSIGLRSPLRSDSAQNAEAIEVATFAIDRHWLALPSQELEECVSGAKLAPSLSSSTILCGYLDYGNRMVPVFDLHTMVQTSTEKRSKHPPFVLIINKPGGWYGLAVDNIDAIPQISKQRLRPLGTMLTPFASVTDAVITHTEQKEEATLNQGPDGSEGMVLLLNNQSLERMLVQHSVGVKSAA